MPTSPGGIRYPSTGGHTDLALYFQQLTEDIDHRVRISVADESARLALVSPAEGLEVYEKATKRIYVRTSTGWLYVWGPPGTVVTAGATLASNWTLNELSLRHAGNGMARFYALLTRTGSTLSVPGDGNLTNTDVLTLPAAWAPLETSPLTTLSAGQGVWGYLQSTSRVVRLVAAAPGSNIASGDQLDLAGWYALADPGAL